MLRECWQSRNSLCKIRKHLCRPCMRHWEKILYIKTWTWETIIHKEKTDDEKNELSGRILKEFGSTETKDLQLSDRRQSCRENQERHKEVCNKTGN